MRRGNTKPFQPGTVVRRGLDRPDEIFKRKPEAPTAAPESRQERLFFEKEQKASARRGFLRDLEKAVRRRGAKTVCGIDRCQPHWC